MLTAAATSREARGMGRTVRALPTRSRKRREIVDDRFRPPLNPSGRRPDLPRPRIHQPSPSGLQVGWIARPCASPMRVSCILSLPSGLIVQSPKAARRTRRPGSRGRSATRRVPVAVRRGGSLRPVRLNAPSARRRAGRAIEQRGDSHPQDPHPRDRGDGHGASGTMTRPRRAGTRAEVAAPRRCRVNAGSPTSRVAAVDRSRRSMRLVAASPSADARTATGRPRAATARLLPMRHRIWRLFQARDDGRAASRSGSRSPSTSRSPSSSGRCRSVSTRSMSAAQRRSHRRRSPTSTRSRAEAFAGWREPSASKISSWRKAWNGLAGCPSRWTSPQQPDPVFV